VGDFFYREMAVPPCLLCVQRRLHREVRWTRLPSPPGLALPNPLTPDCDRAFVRNDALQKHLKQHETSEALDVPMPAPKRTKPKGKAKAEASGAAPLTTTSSRSFDSPKPNAKSNDGGREAHSSSSAFPEGRPGPSTLRHVSETFPPTLNFDWTEARSAGLYEDIDLADVMTSVHSSTPFWTITKRDVEALETIRRLYPQHPHPGPDEPESEDEFDEGVSRNYPAVPETVAVAEEGGAEVRVLSRPRWQVKYVMAKAKLMLVEEENRMRRVQLRDWMEREEAMLQGKELRDLGPAGEAFAEIVREDVQREMEKTAELVNGASHENGETSAPGDPYEEI
jgi:hypothetical protein